MLLNTVLDNGCLFVLLFSDKFFFSSMPDRFMCHCILFNFSSGHEIPGFIICINFLLHDVHQRVCNPLQTLKLNNQSANHLNNKLSH